MCELNKAKFMAFENCAVQKNFVRFFFSRRVRQPVSLARQQTIQVWNTVTKSSLHEKKKKKKNGVGMKAKTICSKKWIIYPSKYLSVQWRVKGIVVAQVS